MHDYVSPSTQIGKRYLKLVTNHPYCLTVTVAVAPLALVARAGGELDLKSILTRRIIEMPTARNREIQRAI